MRRHNGDLGPVEKVDRGQAKAFGRVFFWGVS